MKRLIVIFLFLALSLPAGGYSATTEELENKVNELEKQLKSMKTMELFQDKRVESAEAAATDVKDKWSWLTIGGEYRFRFDSLEGKIHDYVQYDNTKALNAGGMLFHSDPKSASTVTNDSVMLNRFRLKLTAKVYENLTVSSRLSMYKVWGHDTMDPVIGPYFGDRQAAFDGTMGYVPQGSNLKVDYAFATWNNIADTPVWFSIGRRYSTQGVPTTVRQNNQKAGTAGVAGHLIDYAFDGLTVGYAPEIKKLPGAYAKFCYGRGYDSGFQKGIKDTDFAGLFIDPIYTDDLNVELQVLKAQNIFDNLPDSGVATNLGDVDNYGIYVNTRLKDIGAGDLNLFASAAMSKTHPNSNTYALPFFSMDGGTTYQNGNYGLLYDGTNTGSETGESVYLGARYDIKKSGTKLGLEYNHGSKYWLSFTPAADDLWTSKLGTRGSVYEAYVIQELPGTPISKAGNAFIRIGYQYSEFDYTGSNNWVGAPHKISDLNTSNVNLTQMFAPVKEATDIYATLDITF